MLLTTMQTIDLHRMDSHWNKEASKVSDFELLRVDSVWAQDFRSAEVQHLIKVN